MFKLKKKKKKGENKLELDEFKSMGSYDNYFGITVAESDQPETHSTSIVKTSNPARIEKSNSAIYHKDNIDLLNYDDDKENEKEKNDKIQVLIFCFLIV